MVNASRAFHSRGPFFWAPFLSVSVQSFLVADIFFSWASVVAQLIKNPPAMRDTWVGKILWRREALPTPVLWSGEFHGLYV